MNENCTRKVEPRGLNAQELGILQKLLSVEFPGKKEVVDQLGSAQVIGECVCGCNTVELLVDHSLPAYKSNKRIPVEMQVPARNGATISVFLHVVEGYISELEILQAGSSTVEKEINLNDAVITVHPRGENSGDMARFRNGLILVNDDDPKSSWGVVGCSAGKAWLSLEPLDDRECRLFEVELATGNRKEMPIDIPLYSILGDHVTQKSLYLMARQPPGKSLWIAFPTTEGPSRLIREFTEEAPWAMEFAGDSHLLLELVGGGKTRYTVMDLHSGELTSAFPDRPKGDADVHLTSWGEHLAIMRMEPSQSPECPDRLSVHHLMPQEEMKSHILTCTDGRIAGHDGSKVFISGADISTRQPVLLELDLENGAQGALEWRPNVRAVFATERYLYFAAETTPLVLFRKDKRSDATTALGVFSSGVFSEVLDVIGDEHVLLCTETSDLFPSDCLWRYDYLHVGTGQLQTVYVNNEEMIVGTAHLTQGPEGSYLVLRKQVTPSDKANGWGGSDVIVAYRLPGPGTADDPRRNNVLGDNYEPEP